MTVRRYPFNAVTVKYQGRDRYLTAFEHKPTSGEKHTYILRIQLNRRQLESVKTQLLAAAGKSEPSVWVRIPGERKAVECPTLEAIKIYRMIESAVKDIDRRLENKGRVDR